MTQPRNDARDEIGAPARPAPLDYDALRERLRAQGESLPKRLRQVAQAALDRPEDFAFGTVAEIAALAQAQPSTVVRFAQALGFSGFSQLQAIFRARLKAGFPAYGERVAALSGDELRRPSALLEGFALSAQESLERLRRDVGAAELERATEILAGAETIYLIGARRVFPVVAYLAYAFGQLGLRASLVDHLAQLGPEQIALARPGDAALAISVTPYASSTLELAGAAARAGASVVAITDSSLSPLARLSEVWLEAAEADFAGFRSLSASMALALALAVAVAERRRET